MGQRRERKRYVTRSIETIQADMAKLQKKLGELEREAEIAKRIEHLTECECERIGALATELASGRARVHVTEWRYSPSVLRNEVVFTTVKSFVESERFGQVTIHFSYDRNDLLPERGGVARTMADLVALVEAGRLFAFEGPGGKFVASASHGVDNNIEYWVVGPYDITRANDRMTRDEAVALAQRLARGIAPDAVLA
jgi:hypothetical protein